MTLRLRAFLNDERGTATIEFVFIIPIVMLIFMSALESSLYMARHVMLERSVDIVVRSIRLGQLDYLKLLPQATQHAELKELICETSVLGRSVADCITAMKIWMQPVNTADFQMMAPDRFCADVARPLSPLNTAPGTTEFALGTDNDIMLLRICLKEEPLFPTSVISASMVATGEGDGNYALMTTSIFVTEPG